VGPSHDSRSADDEVGGGGGGGGVHARRVTLFVPWLNDLHRVTL
jgi:hypothetical protein